MPKFNCFDKDGKDHGVVKAEDAEKALKKAKKLNDAVVIVAQAEEAPAKQEDAE